MVSLTPTARVHSQEWGVGVLPYKGLMGTCGQSGYVFRDFCLKQGIDFYHFVLNRISFLGEFLKKGIVLGLNRVSKIRQFLP